MEPETWHSDEFPGFSFFLRISWSLGTEEVGKPEMLIDIHTHTPQQKVCSF